MTPTRPIDNAPKTPAEVSARSGRRVAQGGRAAPAAASAPAAPTTVAESLTGARQLIASGKEEVSRIDREQLLAIKTAIQNGTFSIDPEAIADRILTDALGSDA